MVYSLIDFHPSYANKVILVSPCSGHGYKVFRNIITIIILPWPDVFRAQFCSVIGEIVSDLTINGETAHDISIFRIHARSKQSAESNVIASLPDGSNKKDGTCSKNRKYGWVLLSTVAFAAVSFAISLLRKR